MRGSLGCFGSRWVLECGRGWTCSGMLLAVQFFSEIDRGEKSQSLWLRGRPKLALIVNFRIKLNGREGLWQSVRQASRWWPSGARGSEPLAPSWPESAIGLSVTGCRSYAADLTGLGGWATGPELWPTGSSNPAVRRHALDGWKSWSASQEVVLGEWR